MRRSLMAVLMLLALGVGVLCGAAAGLSGRAEAVELTERVEAGDRAALEGLKLTCSTYADNRLLWTTGCTFEGELETRTSFSFFPDGLSWEHERPERGIAIGLISTSFGVSGSAGLELVEEQRYEWDLFWAPVVDVAERTPAGEKRTEQVYVRDYFTFYPLSVNWDGLNGNLEEREASQLLSDFFPIPVPEDHCVEVTVEKGEDGQVYSVDMNTLTGGVDINCSSVPVEGGCYFTLNVFPCEGQEALPQSFDSGVWYLPDPDSESGSQPEPELVFPLEDADVREVQLTGDGSRLLLVVREDNVDTLLVVDRAAMTRVQRLPLFEVVDDGETYREYSGLTVGDGWLLAQATDGSFLLLDQTAGGTYETRIQDSLRPVEAWEYLLCRDEKVLAWDGERLAVAVNQDWYDKCGFYLAVYDRTGLRYAGRYDHSQDAGQPEEWRLRCRPADVVALTMEWAE